MSFYRRGAHTKGALLSEHEDKLRINIENAAQYLVEPYPSVSMSDQENNLMKVKLLVINTSAQLTEFLEEGKTDVWLNNKALTRG